jgi:hypothetical protein
MVLLSEGALVVEASSELEMSHNLVMGGAHSSSPP